MRYNSLVGPNVQQGLAAAIEWPARRVGCSVATELTDVLVKAVRSSPGSLPLLQHTLVELWNAGSGREMTLDCYAQFDGLEGALAKRADKVLEENLAGHEDLGKRIFLRLTQPGEGTEDTRRRVFLSELLPEGSDSKTVQFVIEQLADPDARLIVVDDPNGEGTPVVDVTHEALIRAWPRLRAWIETARDAIRMQHRITDASREWLRLNRDQDQLLRGSRLVEALEW